MGFSRGERIPDPIGTLCRAPWELAVGPFQVAPRTFYVSGQRYVGVYLIETGDGVVLIDTGVSESLYLLLDSLSRIGHRPQEIRAILLSHAHLDHFGAAQALHRLCGAPLYLSREDAELLEKYPQEAEIPRGLHVQRLHGIDAFYDDDRPLLFGEVTIRTRLTPGHTPGCTSFFWDVQNPESGEVYTCAMHGGVGVNTMSAAYYERSRCFAPALRERFLSDIGELKKIPVDIALPSHPHHLQILDRAGTYTDAAQPYLDRSVWPAFLQDRAELVREQMDSER